MNTGSCPGLGFVPPIVSPSPNPSALGLTAPNSLSGLIFLEHATALPPPLEPHGQSRLWLRPLGIRGGASKNAPPRLSLAYSYDQTIVKTPTT